MGFINSGIVGGIDIIGKKTGLACFCVIPFLNEARRLPQEDAYSLDNIVRDEIKGQIKIIVPKLAHISNYDDFDPLIADNHS